MSFAQGSGRSSTPEDPPPGTVPVAPPDQPARTAGPRIPVRAIVVVLLWIVTGGLALLMLGRLTHLDDAVGWPYPAVNALTPLIYLPVYAALVVAFGLRRNLLMILSVPLIVIHLFWTVPELLPGKAEDAPQGSARLRVMSANLRYDNPRADRLSTQIRAADPDVLVLVEASPLTLGRVTSSGALSSYRYREPRPQPGAFGAAVFSRFPLRDAAAPLVGGHLSLRVTVEVDERRRFELYAVHTISPTSRDYVHQWRTQLDTLRRQAHDADLPVIMAGDFNATQDHRPFSRLLDSGVRDTHDVVGAGWTPTWNSRGVVLPPVLRIDHILASPAFAVTGFSVGRDFGSDHRPILADLAMR